MYDNISRPHILNMHVNTICYYDATNQIIKWTTEPTGRYVCAANVHMCMEAYNDQKFLQVVNKADLVVPDGKPLVWALQLLGVKTARQVRGSDLLLYICAEAGKKAIPIGLYGGAQDSLNKIQVFLKTKFPDLNIACAFSPPFRRLTETEKNTYAEKINASGARILFIGLGCPKQEKWMAAHKNKLFCVMIGVGAAFDFLSGTKKLAPRWMQKVGMEWIFRLACDPGRLWERYFPNNPRFIGLFMQQLFREKLK